MKLEEMKLIDILVEELPKRDGWPKRANCIIQDPDKRVEPATCHPSVAKFGDGGFWFLDSSRIGGFEVDTLAIDYTTAIITREQYEASLAAKNEGWIEWGGGECPVEKGTLVDVKLRCGSVTRKRSGESLDWQHDGQYELGAIISYRLHKPQDATTRANDYMSPQDFGPVADEADLNECIGQDSAPVWNGEGVTPPAGCICERSWAGDEWQRCKILFTSNQLVVVKLKESDREDAYNIGDVIFRPIRSEAERKRDEAVKTIMLTGWCQAAAEEIYDLVAAGKVPGMKLED